MPVKKVEEGFREANSHNLPIVDCFMQVLFFSSASFLNPESKNIKTLRSMRANYSDAAIGYVQLKREGAYCLVKAEITPEQRLRAGNYHVSAIIDEEEEEIIVAKCTSCVAHQDGCKHAIAFISWLCRKSQEPSTTEVECYWRRPKLAAVCDPDNFLTAKMYKPHTKVDTDEEEMTKLFKTMNDFTSKHMENIPLNEQANVKNSPSVFHLMIAFKKNVATAEHSAEKFVSFCSSNMTEKECLAIAKNTRAQSDSVLWYAARFARVTASKLYEASRCRTSDGSLINSILGVTKVKTTKAMARGLRLEKEVVKALCKKLGVKGATHTGFVMQKDNPIFGASPDAILGDYVVEIKCPSSQKTLPTYFQNEAKEPANKFKAQIMLQMFMCQKSKGIFCVADPNFEQNKQVILLEVNFDGHFFAEVMTKAEEFWMQNVYPILYANI